MILEALSYKITLDFFKYLKKNRIYANSIKISIWDKTRYEFISFDNFDSLNDFFVKKYTFYDECKLGSLSTLLAFNCHSDVYDFDISYTINDIPQNHSVKPIADFDIQRNIERAILLDRQSMFLNKTINEYKSLIDNLKHIYITGIYSPCYSTPGWSQNTKYFSILSNILDDSVNRNFPYLDLKI